MILITMLVGSMILNGCGKSEENQDASVGKAKTEGSEAGEIVLTFPCIWVGADSKAEVFGKMIEDFNAEYQGKYRVQIEDQTDYGAYRDKLRTLISAGSAPDIFTFSDYSDIELYAQSGNLMDLTEFLSEKNMSDRFQDNAIEEAKYQGIN